MPARMPTPVEKENTRMIRTRRQGRLALAKDDHLLSSIRPGGDYTNYQHNLSPGQ